MLAIVTKRLIVSAECDGSNWVPVDFRCVWEVLGFDSSMEFSDLNVRLICLTTAWVVRCLLREVPVCDLDVPAADHACGVPPRLDTRFMRLCDEDSY